MIVGKVPTKQDSRSITRMHNVGRSKIHRTDARGPASVLWRRGGLLAISGDGEERINLN